MPGKQGGNAVRRAAASLITTNEAVVIALLREMKKKKQQNSENSELAEEKQETEAETQPPAAPNSHKAAPAPQPIKRGQKVGREQGDPWAELLAWKYGQKSQISQTPMAAWWV